MEHLINVSVDWTVDATAWFYNVAMHGWIAPHWWLVCVGNGHLSSVRSLRHPELNPSRLALALRTSEPHRAAPPAA